MPMVQIRGVSGEAHRRLKARAALEGRSLSEYLRLELERIAALPTIEEMIERVSARDPVDLGEPAAEIVRREREAREAGIDRARRGR